jgi:hypothetical protein
VRVTADHSIARLLEELPSGDEWRVKLAVLEPLSSYATSFRYPSSAGNRKPGPNQDQVLIWIEIMMGLSAEIRALVGTLVPGDGAKR